MAVTTGPAAAPRERNNWGSISWLFMRISALALIILTLGHFAIQHVFNDVHNLDLNFVAARWSSVGWRIYDALLLTIGLAHGLNGLRIVADDYVVNKRWNQAVRWAILIVAIILIIVGAVAVIGGVRRA
jgi:succinate dehydrogenase / fumarate reductase, membrane anchor subunit